MANEKQQSDLHEKLIAVNRVSKTVKGGRIFRSEEHTSELQSQL